MARLGFSLLGGFQARLPSGSTLALPTRKAQALPAYLAVPLGQAHPRGELATLLWGDTREESARASLRQALFAIRRAVGETGPPAMVLEGETLALAPSAVDVDVAAFERLMADGSPRAIEEASTLYQGDFLAGFVVDEPGFEQWLVTERERLRELALEGLAARCRRPPGPAAAREITIARARWAQAFADGPLAAPAERLPRWT